MEGRMAGVRVGVYIVNPQETLGLPVRPLAFSVFFATPSWKDELESEGSVYRVPEREEVSSS